MSGPRAGRVCKPRSPRPGRSGRSGRSVLRMMAVMQDRSKTEVPKEFLEGGRTGRRNAMPDILHQPDANMSTADLPDRLQQLTTSDPDNPQPGPSTPHMEVKKDENKSSSGGS